MGDDEININERAISLLSKISHAGLDSNRISVQIRPETSLPIKNYRQIISKQIGLSRVLVVVGATGSGKTTQLPKYIYEDIRPEKRIAVCQPRKVAAISLAKRVAQEMGSDLGRLVGYSVRFDELTSISTKIKFMTDGILLREFMSSPSLSEYSCIILDEVHERSLSTDILLGLLKELVTIRSDLLVILASATMEADKISRFFFNAKTLIIPGNDHRVEVVYTKEPQTNYLEGLFIVFRDILPTLDGHVLIFLTGQEDVEIACKVLRIIIDENESSKVFKIIPMYSSLLSEQQNLAFEEEEGILKVVVATNIAETSITIANIKYVFDCGLCKLSCFNPRTRISHLSTVACSKSSARQRAGRAGRTSDGKCIRLYTKATFENEMPENSPPEIIRVDMSSALLSLLKIGVENLNDFDFFESPPSESLFKSFEILLRVNAVDDFGKLTPHGELISQLPLDPILANILLKSAQGAFPLETLIIIAFIATSTKITTEGGLKDLSSDLLGETGDHETLLNIWMTWTIHNLSKEWCKQNKLSYRNLCAVRNVFAQLLNICISVLPNTKFEPAKEYNFGDVIAVFTLEDAYHTAIRRGNHYIINNCTRAVIHPQSTMASQKPKSIYFSEVFMSSTTFVSLVSTLDQ